MFQIILIFIFGAVVGSFLNVVAVRLIENKSFVTGRSRCPKCSRELKAAELIPLLSFIFLKGRCRSCDSKIDIQYPLVELATGLLFVLAFLKESAGAHSFEMFSALLIRDWFFLSVLIVIFIQDLRHMVILDQVTLPAIVAAAVINYFLAANWLFYFLAAALGAGFFLIQYLVSRGVWVGDGDVRLGALMGFMLGFPGILLALFISYISGAAVAVSLVASKRAGWKSALPLGTFLSVGTAAIFLYGENILKWYYDFLGV